MFKLIYVLIAAFFVALFAILNPHPVAVSVFPGKVLLVPLRISILFAVLSGISMIGIPVMVRELKLKSRIRFLKKENDELKIKTGGE